MALQMGLDQHVRDQQASRHQDRHERTPALASRMSEAASCVLTSDVYHDDAAYTMHCHQKGMEITAQEQATRLTADLTNGEARAVTLMMAMSSCPSE